jgi:hypothetical protein
LASAVESLKSEIKEENERLANSLTAKFEAAHHKIRKDFEGNLSSEIISVSAKTIKVKLAKCLRINNQQDATL